MARDMDRLRAYQRAWVQSKKAANPEWATGVRQSKGSKRRSNIARYQELKEATPCTDCGGTFPFYVMQYDHTGEDKVGCVGSLVHSNVTWPKIEAEIAKCDLVCANCHAIRTHERRGERLA